jgi:hypothetical protein
LHKFIFVNAKVTQFKQRKWKWKGQAAAAQINSALGYNNNIRP